MSQALLNHLNLESAAIGTFIELLDHEAEAMHGDNFNALPGLAQKKMQQAQNIWLLERQREEKQRALGYPSEGGGIDAAIAAGGEALKTAWHALQLQATQAREKNLRNGVMIHTRLDFTRQSISFLQASGKPLYGSDGTHLTGIGRGQTLRLG